MGGLRTYGRIAVIGLLAAGLGCSDGGGDDGAAGGTAASPADDAASSGDGDHDDAAARSGDSGDNSGDGAGAPGTSGSAGTPGTLGGPGAGSSPPVSLPTFPGAGTSDAAKPLAGGMLCDSVAGDAPLLLAAPPATCFADGGDPSAMTAATLEQVLECVEQTDTLHLRLTFHPWFVDNTYGTGAIGWPHRRGHTMRDLVKSDHAEIVIRDGAGQIVLQFKLDYITEDPSSPSGFGSLGVTGGDGSVSVGDASAVVDWSTSLDRNLNERGYSDYTENSPATDESYAPNPDTPEWDYRVVYEAWIDLSIFDGASFEGATIEYVHASPAKGSSDTIDVEPGECPPGGGGPCADAPDADCDDYDPPGGGGGTGGAGGSGAGGTGGNGGDGDPCFDGDPDTFCGGGGIGGGAGGTGGSGSGAGGTGGSGSGAGGTGGNGGSSDPCLDGDPDTDCGSGGSGSGAGGTGGSGSGAGGTGGNGGEPLDPCNDNDPDTFCGPSTPGDPSGDPQYCDDHPNDPLCNVE